MFRDFFKIFSWFGIAVCSLLVLSIPSFAQSTIDVHRYNKREGLPNSYILNITQDHNGFLWVASAGGVSRFDGQHFVNFGIRDGLSNLYVNNVFEDKDHRIWVSSLHEIYEFRSGRLFPAGLEKANGSNYIFSFNQFKNGSLWAFTQKGQFEYLNGKWVEKAFVSQRPDIQIRQVLEINKLTYLITNDELLKQQDGGWEKVAVKPPGAESSSPFFLQLHNLNQQVLTATGQGLFIFDQAGKAKHLFSAEPMGYHGGIAFVDSKQQTWFYPTGGRKVYRAAKGQLEKFTDSLELGVSLFSGPFEDDGHHIWLATGEGLLQALPYKPDFYGRGQFPLLEEIRHLTAIPKGGVLAFSQHFGALRVGKGRVTGFPMENEFQLKGDFPDISLIDKNGFIWLATRRGQLLRFETTPPSKVQKLGNAIRMAYNQPLNRVLAGSDTLFSIDPDALSGISTFRGISPAYISTLSNGAAFIRTQAGEGLLLSKENRLSPAKGWPIAGTGFAQSRFFQDSDSSFWVYYFGGGLKQYSFKNSSPPKLLLSITSDDGLPSDETLLMAKDKTGGIWVITTRGAAVLKRSAAGNSWKVNVLNDAVNLPMPQAEFAAMVADSMGNIWISQLDNIVSINPERVVFETQSPRIVIEDIRLLKDDSTGRAAFSDTYTDLWEQKKEPVFSFNQNTLRIKFTAIGFGSSLPRQFSYQTGSAGTGWSSPSSNSEVILSELVPGNYRFKVRVQTANSNWSKPAEFNFTILPPFWETWWFRLISIFLAATFIILIFRQRIGRLKEKADTRQQMLELEMTALKAQMNPHFIYNALNSIQALVATNRNREANEYIGRFARLLRQVLEQSDNHVITLEKEIQTLQHYISLETLRMDMKPDVQIELQEGLHASMVNLPPLILQPFVENALWHGLAHKGGEKVLHLAFAKTGNGWLTCTLTDNGIGRRGASLLKQQNQTHVSKGIDICTRRLLDFNETNQPYPVAYTDLFNERMEPAGTRVTLYIRL